MSLSSRCGSSPISHRLQYKVQLDILGRVAVPPRSPIGYNVRSNAHVAPDVAVPPRSPIGYNTLTRPRESVLLRFLPDLPSATIV